MAGKLLTTAQAAEMLAVSKDTIRRYVRLGQLEAVRLPSGHYRVHEDQVRALLRREGER